MTRYRVFTVTADMTTAERALWTAYATRERTRRGLAAGASLDVQPDARYRRTGRTVTAPAVTARYTDPVTIQGQPGGVLPLDDAAQAFAPTLVTGSVEWSALSTAYKALIPDPSLSGASGAAMVR